MRSSGGGDRSVGPWDWASAFIFNGAFCKLHSICWRQSDGLCMYDGRINERTNPCHLFLDFQEQDRLSSPESSNNAKRNREHACSRLLTAHHMYRRRRAREQNADDDTIWPTCVSRSPPPSPSGTGSQDALSLASLSASQRRGSHSWIHHKDEIREQHITSHLS